MADSKENTKASDDFADDLDAMLNDVDASNNDQDEFIDDEDAIDRLLMDTSIDANEEDEFAEIDEFAEELVAKVEKIQEPTINEDDEFDVDDLISTSASEVSETDEFAEIDEFAEEPVTTEPKQEENALEETTDKAVESSEIAKNDSDDEFLMANFDISSDDDESDDSEDDEFSEDTQTDDAHENLIEQSIESSSPTQEDAKKVPPPAAIAPPINTEEITQLKVNIDGVNAQISQLWADNEDLKQQLTELTEAAKTKQNDSTTDDIETLQTEQRKLKKSFKENLGKIPVITFVALGIAILALLVGGGLGTIGFSAQSDVTELTETISILEEEIELLIAKDNSKELKQIHQSLALLSEKDSTLNRQLKKVNKALKTTPLKPIVDDLVVQNDHAQQAIELLLAKVETLENRKPVAVKIKKVKKIIPKVMWVVNLVSFKQEWYAKRKVSEFNKKGIPAEMLKVKVNGETWFRLTVKGFKSKYEAAAYAVKVKKTLNLSSAWVTKA